MESIEEEEEEEVKVLAASFNVNLSRLYHPLYGARYEGLVGGNPIQSTPFRRVGPKRATLCDDYRPGLIINFLTTSLRVPFLGGNA